MVVTDHIDDIEMYSGGGSFRPSRSKRDFPQFAFFSDLYDKCGHLRETSRFSEQTCLRAMHKTNVSKGVTAKAALDSLVSYRFLLKLDTLKGVRYSPSEEALVYVYGIFSMHWGKEHRDSLTETYERFYERPQS